jgi:predicted  nucleic acid-binding Zn-ribbon protein
VNGKPEGNSNEKDRAIRAARKAALSISEPRGVIHIEVFEESEMNVVHRDLVLSESLKELDTDNLNSIGMIIPGQFKIEIEKKKEEKRTLFKVGQYVMIGGELHIITDVSESQARAKPVRKRHSKIKDKFTGKEREIISTGRSVSLASTAENVLSKEAVEKELAKIKETEDGINKSSDGSVRDSNRHST